MDHSLFPSLCSRLDMRLKRAIATYFYASTLMLDMGANPNLGKPWDNPKVKKIKLDKKATLVKKHLYGLSNNRPYYFLSVLTTSNLEQPEIFDFT